jgi:hypothetical protein
MDTNPPTEQRSMEQKLHKALQDLHDIAMDFEGRIPADHARRIFEGAGFSWSPTPWSTQSPEPAVDRKIAARDMHYTLIESYGLKDDPVSNHIVRAGLERLAGFSSEPRDDGELLLAAKHLAREVEQTGHSDYGPACHICQAIATVDRLSPTKEEKHVD